MKYRKFNKIEKRQIRSEALKNAMHGEGLYVYENHRNGDLDLPKPTKSGLKKVLAGQQFQGDNYYMQLVRTGELRCIREILSPQQEKNMEQEKLILDQPDRVTAEGTTEQIIKTERPKQKLNETDGEPVPDVLLNEVPVSDGFVILS